MLVNNLKSGCLLLHTINPFGDRYCLYLGDKRLKRDGFVSWKYDQNGFASPVESRPFWELYVLDLATVKAIWVAEFSLVEVPKL